MKRLKMILMKKIFLHDGNRQYSFTQLQGYINFACAIYLF